LYADDFQPRPQPYYTLITSLPHFTVVVYNYNARKIEDFMSKTYWV